MQISFLLEINSRCLARFTGTRNGLSCWRYKQLIKRKRSAQTLLSKSSASFFAISFPCTILIAQCIRKGVIPANHSVRETATANKEELVLRRHGCKATLCRGTHLWKLLWSPWLPGKSQSKTYLGVLTSSRAYILLCLHLERCIIGAPNTTSENIQNTGQKKNYSGFFDLKDPS